MPASDPTTDVPTPTGTLQGVAAFSWDGTIWQPNGRAGPSVATPTGVLQGVAPFLWDGANWQPSGRAKPGIATPTGVLDGVAVYTWSGSAWMPPGGQPTPSTPSGALRGVAAFNWDGSVWQPAGQAGPRVATPYGVLDGVAMFNWTGSAWAAESGPSLDIGFMTPGALDARITFTRASTATYFDGGGVMQTAAANVPRWDHNPTTLALNGLLLENTRTNLLLNSATLGTQGVAVTAQAYALSFYGTGTITMSGAATGSLVGVGAFPQRVSAIINPAAGTLTCTVTGSVLDAQLEAGGSPTSYIPSAGAAVTRSADRCIIPPANMGWFVSPGGSWFAEFVNYDTSIGKNIRIVGQPITGQPSPLFRNPTLNLQQYDGTVGPQTVNTIAPNVVSKAAATWTPGTATLCLNGSAIVSAANLVTGYGSMATNGAAFMQTNVGVDDTENMDGCMRNFRYWPRALSAAEMQAVTT